MFRAKKDGAAAPRLLARIEQLRLLSRLEELKLLSLLQARRNINSWFANQYGVA